MARYPVTLHETIQELTYVAKRLDDTALDELVADLMVVSSYLAARESEIKILTRTLVEWGSLVNPEKPGD